MLEVDAKHAMFALEALFAVFEVGVFPAVVAEIGIVEFVGGDAVEVEF